MTFSAERQLRRSLWGEAANDEGGGIPVRGEAHNDNRKDSPFIRRLAIYKRNSPFSSALEKVLAAITLAGFTSYILLAVNPELFQEYVSQRGDSR